MDKKIIDLLLQKLIGRADEVDSDEVMGKLDMPKKMSKVDNLDDSDDDEDYDEDCDDDEDDPNGHMLSMVRLFGKK